MRACRVRQLLGPLLLVAWTQITAAHSEKTPNRAGDALTHSWESVSESSPTHASVTSPIPSDAESAGLDLPAESSSRRLLAPPWINVDYNASIYASALHLGDEEGAAAILPNATYTVPSYIWHIVYLKLNFTHSANGGWTNNPKQQVQLSISHSDGTANTTTATGLWSKANQWYVAQFRLLLAGKYTAKLGLAAKATPANETSLHFDISVYHLLPAQENSRLELITNGRYVGDTAYVVAHLNTASSASFPNGRPIFVTDGWCVNVTGSGTGAVLFSPFVRLNDSSWVTALPLQHAETLTVTLTVAGEQLPSQQINVTNPTPAGSPADIGLLAQLQAPMLQIGTNQQSSQNISQSAELQVYVGEDACIYISAQTPAGDRLTTDPGLMIYLLMDPVSPDTILLDQYNLQSSNSSSSNSSSSNSSTATNTSAPLPISSCTGNSTDIGSFDYSTEPLLLDPSASGEYPGLQCLLEHSTGISVSIAANYSLPSSAVQLLGVFNASQSRYIINCTAATAQTYAAALWAKASNTSAVAPLMSFYITAVSRPAANVSALNPANVSANTSAVSNETTATAPAPAAINTIESMLNPFINPSVNFVVTFQSPYSTLNSSISSSSNTTLADAYGPGFTDNVAAAIAEAAGLPSSDWVQATSVPSAPMALNVTVYFTANYQDASPYGGVSAVDHFVFMLLEVPDAVLGNDTHPELAGAQAVVSNVTVIMPDSNPVDGASFLASAAGDSAAAAFTVVNMSDISSVISSPQPLAAFNWSTVVDTQPPVLLLRGQTYTELLEGQQFLDLGVAVSDNIDGNGLAASSSRKLCTWQDWITTAAAADSRALSCSTTAVAAISTRQPTRNSTRNEVYVITYSASDTAGNVASPVRRYITIVPRCMVSEHWCSSLQVCSVKTLCLKPLSTSTNSSSADPTSTPIVYTAKVDKIPPRLQLLGCGTAAVSTGGSAVMIDTVIWLSAWKDPGVEAVDAVDGDLVHSVQTYGAGAVDTSRPTPPGQKFSYAVQYSVTDLSGNTAPTAYRLIRVVCPYAETFCTDPLTGQPTCSVGGTCGMPDIDFVSLLEVIGYNWSGNNNTYKYIEALKAVLTPLWTEPQAPSISLVHPGDVEVPAGFVYDRCGADAAVDEVCERGATATDAHDGNLGQKVQLCGYSWVPPAGQRPIPLALACGIPITTPGAYNITFSVTNSAGATASVTRQMTIVGACGAGAALCPDKVSCSDVGVCMDPTYTLQSAAPAAAVAATTDNSATIGPDADLKIKLITTCSFGSVVKVKQMSPYVPCREGRAPTSADPCEPGATASWLQTDSAATGSYYVLSALFDGTLDGTSSDQLAANVLDLSADVVVCLPTKCLTVGCSPVELRRHRLSVKGLAGCGVDTTTAVGTRYNITFWVWAHGTHKVNMMEEHGPHVLVASVTRTLVISDPCPDASARYLCTATSSNSTFCSGVRCKQAQILVPSRTAGPQIQILPSNATIYIEYGKPAILNLGACDSDEVTTGCGAVAWDVDSAGARTDITRYITVTGSADCNGADASGLKVCMSCSVDTLSSGARCFPGFYTLTYSVTNDAGLVTTATRTVVVYQHGQVSARLPLIQDATNATAAAVLVADLQNGASKAVDMAARSVISKLGSAGQGLLPSDVRVLGAQLVQNGSQAAGAGSYNVYVNVTVLLYHPAVVHSQKVSSTAVVRTNVMGRKLLHSSSASSSDSKQTSMQGLLQDLVYNLHNLAAAVDREALCEHSRASSQLCSRVPGRRQLLATTTSMNANISAVAASLSSYGAVNMTTTSSADIDELQGYLNTLWSSVDNIEQQMVHLQGDSTTAASKVDLVFGTAANQQLSDADSSAAAHYQALLADWQALVGNITALTDQAAARFTHQSQAAQGLSAVTAHSITAILDAVELAQRLQQQFTEQQLLLTAGSRLYDWECDRSSSLAVGFTITRNSTNTSSENSASAKPTSSQVAGYSTHSTMQASTATSNTSTPSWQYIGLPRVATRTSDEASSVPTGVLQEEGSSAEAAGAFEGPGRYIGAGGSNQLIGGLLLHTTRKTISTDCSGSAFNKKFSLACQRRTIPWARNSSSSVSQYLAALFAADSNDLLPYGVDPAFLRSSRLYQAQLQGRVGWFYNVSDELEVPGSTGVPRGFYTRRLQGYLAGFPILLPTVLTQQRSAVTMQYLKDGNYLDDKSRGLTAEMLTYNAHLEVLGFSRMRFEWQANGVITGTITVQSLPDLLVIHGNRHEMAVAWLLPLWLMVVWHVIVTLSTCVATASETVQGRGKHAEQHWIKGVLTCPGDLADVSSCILMLVAVMMLTAFCTHSKGITHPQAVYYVYDAVNSAPARMFMPAKAFSEAAAAAAGGKLHQMVSSSSSPGAAGRWVFPDNDQDFDKLAMLFADVRGLVQLWDAYALVQGVVLLLLTVRLLHAWSFQAKLGLILRTLSTAAPQLAHLLLVILAVSLIFSGLINLAWGIRVSQASSYPAAFQETFSTMLGLGTVRVWDIAPIWEYLLQPELLFGLVVYYLLVAVFILLLMQYFMAVIGKVFIKLKRQMAGSKARSIVEDVTTDVLPELLLQCQQLTRKAAGRRGSSGSSNAASAGSVSSTALLGALNKCTRTAAAGRAFAGSTDPHQEKNSSGLLLHAMGCKINAAVLQQLLAQVKVLDMRTFICSYDAGTAAEPMHVLDSSDSTVLIQLSTQQAKAVCSSSSGMQAAAAAAAYVSPGNTAPSTSTLAGRAKNILHHLRQRQQQLWTGLEQSLGYWSATAGEPEADCISAEQVAQQLMQTLGTRVEGVGGEHQQGSWLQKPLVGMQPEAGQQQHQQDQEGRVIMHKASTGLQLKDLLDAVQQHEQQQELGRQEQQEQQEQDIQQLIQLMQVTASNIQQYTERWEMLAKWHAAAAEDVHQWTQQIQQLMDMQQHKGLLQVGCRRLDGIHDQQPTDAAAATAVEGEICDHLIVPLDPAPVRAFLSISGTDHVLHAARDGNSSSGAAGSSSTGFAGSSSGLRHDARLRQCATLLSSSPGGGTAESSSGGGEQHQGDSSSPIRKTLPGGIRSSTGSMWPSLSN